MVSKKSNSYLTQKSVLEILSKAKFLPVKGAVLQVGQIAVPS